ncbi:hypothetical protein PF008_g17816 [Phytophthora fragariae]|uniref:Retrotransposon gag domain-containing protein n=1 Tax=Phytophthora fragariae TaxID=53985 RepID=A0A6G0R7Z2_9STRA|nr:hypothetical protein PF008_g17816 [Phytophthora fragariae]
MTATLTRTKTGKTRRVPKQAKNPPIEDEVAGDDERDELGHQHQQTGGTTAGRTATTGQDGDQRGSRVAEREAEIAMTDAPSNESGQSATQVEETTTTNTSDDATTMDAAAMTAAIQHLMTAAGLQPGTATTGSKRNQKKPMTKTRRRAGADDDEDERSPRTNQQRVTTKDAPSTAARVAPSTNPTTRNAAPSGGPSTGEQAAGTPAAGTPDISAMAAAIRDLTAMVSGLQPTEPNEGERGRRMQRRTTRGATRTRRTTPDSSDSSSRSSHTHRRRARSGHRSRRRRGSGGGDGDSSSSSDDSSSSSSSSSSPSSESGDGRRRGSRPTEPPARGERPPGRRSVKELELPTFTPSPKVSVSTWIDRVDLALKGAAKSGRGKWSDHALYFILGNQLMKNAAKWWVNQDRRLKKRQRTWTNPKKALLWRYGPKLDKSNAELRVTMRRMMPGETYADFAAGLRDVVGRSRVKERVLLAQFLRCLDKTTKKLVQQRPKPKTLEEAVDKATEIDDPMDNVAQGMANIGQPWAVAPSHHLMTMTGTTGPMSVIPGISGTGLPTEMANAFPASGGKASGVALFTNPQGV